MAPGLATLGATRDALGNIIASPSGPQPGGQGGAPDASPPPEVIAQVQATVSPEEFRNYSQDPMYWWRKAAELTDQAMKAPEGPQRYALETQAQTYQEMGKNVERNRGFWSQEKVRAKAESREDQAEYERALTRIDLTNYRNATLAISRDQVAIQRGNLDLSWANHALAAAKNPAEIEDIYARIAYQKRMAGVAERQVGVSEEESRWRYQPDSGLEWQKLDEQRANEKQRIQEAMAGMGIKSADILGSQYNTATQNAMTAAGNALLPGQEYPMGWEPGGGWERLFKGMGSSYTPPPPNGGTMIYPYQGYQQSADLIKGALQSLQNLPPAIVQALAQMAGQNQQPQPSPQPGP